MSGLFVVECHGRRLGSSSEGAGRAKSQPRRGTSLGLERVLKMSTVQNSLCYVTYEIALQMC